MKRAIFLLLLTILLGCNSDSKKTPNNPLSGINQFEVALLFSSSEDLDQESFFKTVVSSFEKVGNVHISGDAIYNISNASPILLLSYGMQGEKRGSMNVFAEAEVLTNRYHVGSQVWKMDFNFYDHSVFPEMEDGKVVFKEVPRSVESMNAQQSVEKMIEQFAQAYHDGNPNKPTFRIHSKLILPSEGIPK